MTRAELIRDYISDMNSYRDRNGNVIHDIDVDKFDMCICSRCIDALHSRGEKIMRTEECVISGWDLGEFLAYGGLDTAEDDTEPSGCEWCEEIDDLYGVIFI